MLCHQPGVLNEGAYSRNEMQKRNQQEQIGRIGGLKATRRPLLRWYDPCRDRVAVNLVDENVNKVDTARPLIPAGRSILGLRTVCVCRGLVTVPTDSFGLAER